MTAREFVDWTDGLINNKNQKLVGDITHGYSYMDTDKAAEMQKRENAVVSAYCKNDVRSTDEACRRLMINSFYGLSKTQNTIVAGSLKITFLISIVFWRDGSKTVVKCGDGDAFDPEKGLAMAIAKRVYGDKGRYYETFKKWLPEEEEAGRNIQRGFRAAIGLQEEKHMTLKEYCSKYNITKNVAYGMIKRGDLHAYKDEKGKWIIPIN